MNAETQDMVCSMNAALQTSRIKGECVEAKSHRHMAFYDVRLGEGTSISRLERQAREIACSIKSKTTPIIKVIPELGIVRLQVATRNADHITLSDVASRQKIPTVEENLLPMVLGETDEGKRLWMDMSKNPHLLVAGGTGSGKSVLLHTVICNALLLQALGQRKIDLYLSDPKRSEFIVYEDQPNTFLAKDYIETVSMLQTLEREMEFRYAEMEQRGKRSIDEDSSMFPMILVVIDEAADLMMQDNKQKLFESSLIRLAQKARAAGIYLVLATQRPSAKIITADITANFPGRIACKVPNQSNSRIILDQNGAETLLGRGDAILKNMTHDYVRFQAAYTDPKQIIEFILSLKN